MRNLNAQNLTDVALERIAQCPDPRLKQVMTALISHLHDFSREVELTTDEWGAAIAFLTEAGHITDENRQEFILLSDTLGLSALVDLLHNRSKSAKATESSLLGPFYRKGAPEMTLDSDISGATQGERIVVRGRVTSADGDPIAGALLEVWQASPAGLYDVQEKNQQANGQPAMNLRARVRTDREGRFRFRTVKPASYPVPHDGPVGRMLAALAHHPYRPAHIHFIVVAPGHEPLVTALYINGDKYLDSDVVFGSRQSLIVSYQPADKKRAGADSQMDSIEFDFVLSPARPQ